MQVCDYIDENGNFRTAHHGVRRYSTDTMIGCRKPGAPRYGSGALVERWQYAKEHARLPTDPMDNPPTVN